MADQQPDDQHPVGRFPALPEGLDFLKLVWKIESECEREADEALTKLGAIAPKTIVNIGTVLSLLYQFATCAWTCPGNDHLRERIVGRAVSLTDGAVRLARMGLYDEALALVRGVGEIANLLGLFLIRPDIFTAWEQLAPDARRREFGPVKVRLKIEAEGLAVPIDEARYATLSGLVTHVTPEIAPQAFNAYRLNVVGGGIFQEAGLLVALNEAALALFFVARFAARLSNLDAARSDYLVNAADDLGKTIGGVLVTKLADMWKSIKRGASTKPGDAGTSARDQ